MTSKLIKGCHIICIAYSYNNVAGRTREPQFAWNWYHIQVSCVPIWTVFPDLLLVPRLHLLPIIFLISSFNSAFYFLSLTTSTSSCSFHSPIPTLFSFSASLLLVLFSSSLMLSLAFILLPLRLFSFLFLLGFIFFVFLLLCSHFILLLFSSSEFSLRLSFFFHFDSFLFPSFSFSPLLKYSRLSFFFHFECSLTPFYPLSLPPVS
jgi:hypothetical protein